MKSNTFVKATPPRLVLQKIVMEGHVRTENIGVQLGMFNTPRPPPSLCQYIETIVFNACSHWQNTSRCSARESIASLWWGIERSGVLHQTLLCAHLRHQSIRYSLTAFLAHSVVSVDAQRGPFIDRSSANYSIISIPEEQPSYQMG